MYTHSGKLKVGDRGSQLAIDDCCSKIGCYSVNRAAFERTVSVAAMVVRRLLLRTCVPICYCTNGRIDIVRTDFTITMGVT